MRFIVADWETYFDSKEYTLSKMTTESYIRDPRFEAHGCAIKWSPDLPAKWWNRHELPALFAQVNWSDVFMIHHHAQFDSLIESHHYNIHPKMIGCTLSMARLMIGNHLSVSLESVRKHFGIPSKTTPYNLFNGKRWDELSPAVQQQIGVGACDEVESIFSIFQRFMADGFPVEELEVVDLTVKMFSEPVLRADVNLLAAVWEREAALKTQRMEALGVTSADLQSAARFVELLRAEGVEVEQKDGKNGPIWALAKTDQFLRDLLEHDNEHIRLLAEARVGAKSTLMQTRAETLGSMSQRGGGSLPVYLRYCGAHTSRWSGGDGCLTRDTNVLVFDNKKGLTNKKIVDIRLDDLIWDGANFVAHDGIKFSGYQEVIEHDGVKGTKNHVVYTRDHQELTLERARETKARLMVCKKPNSGTLAAARKASRHQ